jgi:hypothetical protein
MLYEGCQNDFKNGNIKKYGCYFLDICRLAELQTGADFSFDDVEKFYIDGMKNNFLGLECFIMNGAGIYNMIAGKNIYNHVTSTIYKPETPGFIVCNVKPGFKHFTLSYNGYLWDSLDPARPAAKTYTVNSYRVLS